MMMWDKEMETISRKKLEELQLERLKWTMNRVYTLSLIHI